MVTWYYILNHKGTVVRCDDMQKWHDWMKEHSVILTSQVGPHQIGTIFTGKTPHLYEVRVRGGPRGRAKSLERWCDTQEEAVREHLKIFDALTVLEKM